MRVINRTTLPALLALLLIPLFVRLDTGGADFDTQFYAAAHGWPYLYEAVPIREVEKGGIFGIFLPWAIALLQPIGLIPLLWARALIQAGTLAALLLLAGPRPAAWVATLSSAPAILLVFHYANLDALSALGIFMPAAGGLFLLAIKPQVAGVAALVWLAGGKWRSFLPFALVVLLSTLLWPEWLLRVQESPAGALNISFFPWTLLLGLPLLWRAVRQRDLVLAALASPLLAPYIAYYSLAPVVALLARRRWWLGFLANGTSWLLLLWLMVRMSTQ